jgi:predicted ATPase
MGGVGRQEQLALGEVPNVASRVQGIAQPDTVVMSAETYRLVQGFFECEPLGEQNLRGVSQPIAVYRVLRESGVQSRLDVASSRGLTPLVGREQEVGLLLQRWEHAKDGQGQVMLLTGEAGIGKSRLVQVLKDSVVVEPHTRWECRSSPYYQNTALYPLIDLMQRAMQWRQEETPEEKFERLEQTLSQYRLPLEETVPLFASLLSLPLLKERYPPLQWTPQRQRQKTLESLVAIVLELAEREPVLFILEDLHWTDPTTLEFLSLLVEQVPTTALYTLLTCRPHFQPAWHHRSYLTEITVNRLSRNQIEQVAIYVAGGKTLPAEIMQQLVDKTDGVPLYCEEMTKAILESGSLKEIDGRYELTGTLPTLAIPATLHDSLMARLDRLVTAKAIAQYAAVIGRQFSYELLQAVSELEQATLQRELSRLVEAELLYQRGLPPHATYIFKHALIQDTAYESLLRSTKQAYHRRIADVLAARFPEATENQPELLAHHYTEAGRYEQAIDYWHKAGQRALVNLAYVETIAHVTNGLALLETCPDIPLRVQHELEMQLMLGAAWMATKGYGAPEAEHAYMRSQELCQQMSDTPRLADVLYGLRRVYTNRGELRKACATAEQSLRLAHQTQDDATALESHYSLGYTLFQLGEFTTASTHLEHGIASSDRLQQQASLGVSSRTGIDVGLCCRIILAWVLYVCGYLERALQNAGEVVRQSQARANPYTQAYVLSYAGFVHQFCRQVSAVYEEAEILIPLCREQKYGLFEAYGMHLRGWALGQQGQTKEGLRQIHQGVATIRATGRGIVLSHFLALLAEAYGTIDQAEEGLHVLDGTLAQVHQTEERYYEAEIHRLKGVLLLQQNSDNQAEAETCFQQAIAIAQDQQAKSWELRAATSLARLWQPQGKRQEAYDLLAPVYNWFTEGFDTADLKDAKTLLDALQA